jgi:hypothetical protein
VDECGSLQILFLRDRWLREGLWETGFRMVVQEDSRNSYYAVASSFKEKAREKGTPPSAVSGFAAFSSDGRNSFYNASSVIFLSMFVFCILLFFFHSVTGMLHHRLEETSFSVIKFFVL